MSDLDKRVEEIREQQRQGVGDTWENVEALLAAYDDMKSRAERAEEALHHMEHQQAQLSCERCRELAKGVGDE